MGLAVEHVAKWEEDFMNGLMTEMRVVRRKLSGGWGGGKGDR